MPVLGAVASSSTSAAPEFTVGYSAANLRRWRKQLAEADYYSHSARMLWLQDSIGSYGTHDATPGTLADEVYRRLRTSPHLTSFSGTKNEYGPSFTTTDTEASTGPLLLTRTGTGWSAAGKGPGGDFGVTNSGVAGDRMYFQRNTAVAGTTNPTTGGGRIWYRAQTGGGGFTVTGGGGTVTLASTAPSGSITNGSIALFKFNIQSVLTAPGSYINITGNGPVEIVAVELAGSQYLAQLLDTDVRWDGQLGITWSKLARGLRKVDDFITASAFEYIDFYKPDLTLIMLQANSVYSDTGASYSTKLDTLVAHLQSIGSDVVVIGTPTPGTPGVIDDLIAVSKTVCLARGAIYYDTAARWGSRANAVADGYMGADNLHPTPMGVNDIGRGVAEMLLRA